MNSLCLTLSLSTALLAAPQEEPNAAQLDLDRLFARDFQTSSPRPIRWLENGVYSIVEADPDGGGDAIVRYDAATGSKRVVVGAAELTPPNADSALHIADYQWSNDQSRLLLFTNTRRVWRYHTRGDYWVLDRNAKTLHKLGGDGPEATLQFAKFSPDGQRVAYVRERDLWVEDLGTSGSITRLTHSDRPTLINGTFDWVYEEELSLRDGFRWSPDSRWIAFWQIDSSGVGIFRLENLTEGLYPKITEIPYPKVGTTNPAARVGVVSADGGDPTWMNIEGDPRQNYLARMEWAANSDELVVQHLNRLQNTNRVLLCSRESGESRAVHVDRDEAWVDIGDDFRWFDQGASFLWLSETNGWRHAYRISRDGTQVVDVTPGDYDVVEVVLVDEDQGWLYFLASPDDPTRRALFRASLREPGPPTRLTPADQRGIHRYQLSPDGTWAVHSWSTLQTPPTHEFIRLPSHQSVRTVIDHADVRQRLAALDSGDISFFRIPIEDGIELDAWQILPPEFDPEKQWPVVFHVYGEPAGQTVLDRWPGFNGMWHRMLAQQGYVVISIDNRGTPAPRGRDWRKSVYGQIGSLASRDQAAAVRWLQEQHSWIDRTRIGYWGWSGGGSMSLNMIFRYPELVQTAIAIAFIADQRYYDTLYQERYMGLPTTNAEGFRHGSPITWAHQLEGNLLMIYGTGDDNCHYQNCEALVDRLIAEGKHFSLMAYPNRSHSIREGAGTRQHLYGLMTRYLNDNLPAGPR